MGINDINSPVFAPDLTLLAYSIGDTVFFRSTVDWQLNRIVRFNVNQDGVLQFIDRTINPPGDFSKEFEELKYAILNYGKPTIKALSFTAKSNLLFVNNPAWWLVFNLESAEIIYSEVHNPSRRNTTVISTDGLYVADSYFAANTLEKYDIKYHQRIRLASTGELVLDHRTRARAPAAMAWSPDSQMVAYRANVNCVLVLDVHQEKEEQIGAGHDWTGTHLSWSPCGKYLAMYSVEDGLQVVNIDTKLVCANYNESTGKKLQKSDSNCFSWTPVSRRICLCRKSGKPEFWDPPLDHKRHRK